MPTPATKNSLAHHDLLALMAMGFEAAKSVVLDEPRQAKPLDPTAYWQSVLELMRAVGPIEPCRVPANDPAPQPVEHREPARTATARAKRSPKVARAEAPSSSGDDEPGEGPQRALYVTQRNCESVLGLDPRRYREQVQALRLPHVRHGKLVRTRVEDWAIPEREPEPTEPEPQDGAEKILQRAGLQLVRRY